MKRPSLFISFRKFVYDAELNTIFGVNQDPFFKTSVVGISLPNFEVKDYGLLSNNYTWGSDTAYDYKNKILLIQAISRTFHNKTRLWFQFSILCAPHIPSPNFTVPSFPFFF
eukprot:TRINITY_DN731_c0_g2_i3.p1 TRINITY_DN731_c0_g2~~TRINITY_DN731_c0_g2_i3.p1  ORF type:complete len:112 (+),score=10.44 TRINITY_DN731_c0_g2_i3:975-1310(+)